MRRADRGQGKAKQRRHRIGPGTIRGLALNTARIRVPAGLNSPQVPANGPLRAGTETAAADGPAAPEGRLVDRAPEQLRPHPVYLDACGSVATGRTAHNPAGSTPVIAPLLTTRDGLILDGHTRWQLALQEGRFSVACIEYDLTGEQVLLLMLDQYRPADRLNAFCRIVMALALEPYWRAQARERQRQGGTEKLSSTLTKASAIDVRAELARAAGAGAGNISKVKQLLETTHPARCATPCARGEISIHRAWQWRHLAPDQQNARLDQYRHRKDIHHTIRHLLRQHCDPNRTTCLSLEQVAARLASPRPRRISARHAVRGRPARPRAHRNPRPVRALCLRNQCA